MTYGNGIYKDFNNKFGVNNLIDIDNLMDSGSNNQYRDSVFCDFSVIQFGFFHYAMPFSIQITMIQVNCKLQHLMEFSSVPRKMIYLAKFAMIFWFSLSIKVQSMKICH